MKKKLLFAIGITLYTVGIALLSFIASWIAGMLIVIGAGFMMESTGETSL